MSEEKNSKKEQCKKTFTFHFNGLPTNVTFRCMKEKHTDGKHEHIGISTNGGGYKVSWTDPQSAIIKDNPVFVQKELRTTQ